MLFRRSSRLIVLLWQPSMAAICRWLLPATRRADIWYRCVWVSCRYFITASLWSVKPVRVPATALLPLPRYAKVLQLLSEFTSNPSRQRSYAPDDGRIIANLGDLFRVSSGLYRIKFK